MVRSCELAFTPHKFDRILGAKDVTIAAKSVKEVGIEPSSLSLFAGGFRKRLRIDTVDGQIHLFVVNDVYRVAEEVKAVIGFDSSFE